MKTILLTGAGNGIGLELARTHAQRGDRVFATHRSESPPRTLAALGLSFGVALHHLDVCCVESIHATANSVAAGCRRIDVLYNNAAVNSRTIAERLHTPPDSFLPVPVDGELGRVKLQEADMMFKINALGPLAVVQAFQGLLASSVVVNMSSDSGSITQKDAGGNYGYAASKAALNMITRTLAFDLRARDITVVALHPGWCRTSIGGPNAQLDPRVQSAVIVKLVDSLEMEHSGRFLSAVDGADVPW